MIRYITIIVLLVAVSAGTANAQTSAAYEEFLAKAVKSFGARASTLDTKYKLADAVRWDFLQADGLLRFSFTDGSEAVATAQILGSYSTYSHTWMWAWANSTVDPLVRKDIAKLRQFGQEKKFAELFEPKFDCDEAHAWKLTAAAGYVLDAKGAFRGPIEDGWVYFLITDIRRKDK